MAIYSRLAACPLETEPFKDHPSTRGRRSDRTQKQATAKAAWVTFSTDIYLADMLASVYSYRVMAKSVSSFCVRGRRVLSNPVTIMQNLYVAMSVVNKVR